VHAAQVQTGLLQPLDPKSTHKYILSIHTCAFSRSVMGCEAFSTRLTWMGMGINTWKVFLGPSG
jgi:hypothetical protein